MIGLVVNPIAGLGGKVGLKGTDGEKIVIKAKRLGAKPSAPDRAIEMLTHLNEFGKEIEFVTYPYEMGEYEAIRTGFTPKVIGSIMQGKTRASDTKHALMEMVKIGVELLIFVGGDGTARDVFDVIDGRIPVLGVPAGVKIYSSVFALNPRIAAEIAVKFIEGKLVLREAEVMDIDEDAYRHGELSIRFYGYMHIPDEPLQIQHSKVASSSADYEIECQKAIAKYVTEEMQSNCFYIIGPGTTTKAIFDFEGLKKTLLGVDVLYNSGLVAADVNEKQILSLIKDKKAKIIVTPIGGASIHIWQREPAD